jgi:hypothetical protein
VACSDEAKIRAAIDAGDGGIDKFTTLIKQIGRDLIGRKDAAAVI